MLSFRIFHLALSSFPLLHKRHICACSYQVWDVKQQEKYCFHLYFRSWWILGHYTHTYSSLPLAICEAARTSWHLFSRPFFHKLQAHNAPSIRTHISTLTSNPWHCWVGTQLDIWDAALPSLVCVYGCRPKTFILISSCVCHGPTWMVKAASTCFCIFQVHNDASVGKQQASSITYQPLKWEPPSVKCNRTTRANTVFYGCLKDVALTGNLKFWKCFVNILYLLHVCVVP